MFFAHFPSPSSPSSSSIIRHLCAVKCLGTEDRVDDESKKVAAAPDAINFVVFPGNEIKDLYVHEGSAAEAAAAPVPEPPKKTEAKPPNPPQQQQQRSNNNNNGGGRGTESSSGGRGRGRGRGEQQGTQQEQRPRPAQSRDQQPKTRAAGGGASTGPETKAGTGEHLSKMRFKGPGVPTAPEDKPEGDFDYVSQLSKFDKAEVLATVATESASSTEPKYVKDDFFDSLSCDQTDRESGRSTRPTRAEESTLNQDTFGAIALQSNNYRRGGRGGRGGYRGGGGGRSQGGGRGRGRGRGPPQSA